MTHLTSVNIAKRQITRIAFLAARGDYLNLNKGLYKATCQQKNTCEFVLFKGALIRPGVLAFSTKKKWSGKGAVVQLEFVPPTIRTWVRFHPIARFHSMMAWLVSLLVLSDQSRQKLLTCNAALYTISTREDCFIIVLILRVWLWVKGLQKYICLFPVTRPS